MVTRPTHSQKATNLRVASEAFKKSFLSSIALPLGHAAVMTFSRRFTDSRQQDTYSSALSQRTSLKPPLPAPERKLSSECSEQIIRAADH